MQHALRWLADNQGYSPDVVVYLRPTSPLRRVEDIEEAIVRLLQTGADRVRSICLVEHHPYWMKKLDGERLVPLLEGVNESRYYRRQLLPPVYRLNGAVDVTWRKTIMDEESFFCGDVGAYVMPLERSIDLNSELDFALAELLLQG